MELIEVTPFGLEELVERVRQTPLRGFEGVRVYQDAVIELERGVDPETLAPAQSYVLGAGVARTVELRAALAQHGVDPFDLRGGAWFRTAAEPDVRRPLLPPVVEESVEADGRAVTLVADGLHRVYAARSLGLPVTVLSVRGLPPEYPYYAYPSEGGWAGVTQVDRLAEGQQKKRYRVPTGYKQLFRDFNAVFPGVQDQRPQTNPSHLIA